MNNGREKRKDQTLTVPTRTTNERYLPMGPVR